MTSLFYLAALLFVHPSFPADAPLAPSTHPQIAVESHAGQETQFDAVTSAIAKGDVTSLATYLDRTVELALPGIDDIFTKDQAVNKLKGFFGLNPPTGFVRVHGGTSKGDIGAYVIGTLSCGTDKYRVYIYGTGDANPRIQEIRIEKQ